ncbi:hypothetical protein RLOatenuis_1930 [Rickettsiales bacterium]|nr:hypothetical protein RLOatenuis_1930 [Rickettsiales bacterium]
MESNDPEYANFRVEYYNRQIKGEDYYKKTRQLEKLCEQEIYDQFDDPKCYENLFTKKEKIMLNIPIN